MKSLIFQISNSKIWRISALKVYFKLNQKVVRKTLHMTNLFDMGQIVLYLKIVNFKIFRGKILQIFDLLINDFIDFFWLYLNFRCIRMLLQKLFPPTWLCLKNIPKTRQQSMYLMVIVSIIVQWSPQNFPVSSLFCAKEHLVMMISIILPPRHSY